MQGSFHSLQPCGKRKQVIKVLYCHVCEILKKDSLQVSVALHINLRPTKRILESEITLKQHINTSTVTLLTRISNQDQYL